MDRHELDGQIETIAKTLFAYCAARTPNQLEAEDLAQDILVEVYQSAEKIRSADAFYGFMWAVARHVTLRWLRKREKNRACELTDNLPDAPEPLPEEDDTVRLLRRELSLLSRRYRQAVVLYYVEGKSCPEISARLQISESMVKYLLFKSRQILKEGMSMERTYGPQSYAPKELSLLFWGSGAESYYKLCDNKISQNILYACYHNRLTAEQISLAIGVALPYMEDKLAELAEHHLLKKVGQRYTTNIVIFTNDFSQEVSVKTAALCGKIADILTDAVSAREADIRRIGFSGADMGGNSFAWQVVCMALHRAVIELLQGRVKLTYPREQFGIDCFIWAAEQGEHSAWESPFGFGVSNIENDCGDYVQCMDFPINGEMVHHCIQQHAARVFLDIAKGRTAHFSENDLTVAAELVRKGYVLSSGDELRVNAPVFTREQHRMLMELLAGSAESIVREAEALMDTVTDILKNHVPTHLQPSARDMAYLRLFEDAISAPVSVLCDRKFLLPYHGGDVLPTTYVILNA